MSTDRLRENLDAVAEAAGGVARLRELILQLAVQGKLVEQDPKDEPAAQLVKRLREQRKLLVQAGQLPPGMVRPSHLGSETPWQIPTTWEHVALGEVTACLDFMRKPISSAERQQRSGPIPYYGANGQVGWIDEYLFDEPLVLVVEDETFIGRTKPFSYVIEGKSWVNNHAHVLRPLDGLFYQFLNIMLMYYPFIPLTSGTTNRRKLTQAGLSNAPIAIPPLAEQKRIVAKVDELMALCDELEQKQEQRHTVRRAAHTSALDALTNAQTPDELAHAWERLQKHWDVLAAHADAVPPLRQAILQLAVQGRLVLQNPDDEPASVLMEKIAAELASREDERLRSYGDNSGIKPFPLPTGWVWARLSQVGLFGRGKSKHRPRNDPALYRDGKYPFVQTGDVARAPGLITSYTQMYSELGFQQSRIWPKGTLCITIAANIAESAILGFDACFPDSVVGLEPTAAIGETKFFSYFLRTARARLEQFAPSTAQKNINLGILDSLAVPLPPLAEQKRIVARVDELMALCDSLEQRAREQEALASQLAHAAVAAVATG